MRQWPLPIYDVELTSSCPRKVVNFSVMPQLHLSWKRSARESGKRWSATRPSSVLAKTSAFTAAHLRSPRASSTASARSASSIRPSPRSAIVGAAFGAALTGMRPVAEFQFMDFIGCAFNQISNMVAKAHYRWGAPAPAGAARPKWRRRSWRAVPFAESGDVVRAHAGLKVICPATAYDAKGLIKVRDSRQQPGALLRAQVSLSAHQGRAAGGRLHVPIGKARIAREGTRLSVITYAAMVYTALEAAEILRKKVSSSRSSTCARCCRSTAKRLREPSRKRTR